MLGHTWRLRASNTQNQNITVTVTARYFKFASDGSLAWSAEQTLINGTSVAATSGTTASATVDNSANKYLGAEVTLSCTAATATNGTGTLALTLERSTDGGATWAAQDLGQWVGGHTLVAADGTGARRRNILIR